jgi:outer membrane biosynthesis protein TonB
MARIEAFFPFRLCVVAAATFLLAPFAAAGIAPSSTANNAGGPGCSETSAPVLVSSDVMRDQLTSVQQTANPPSKAVINTTGVVVLSVVVDCGGKVIGNTVVAGTGAMASAATTAVNSWTYKPYLVNGAPVKMQSNVTMTFGKGK